MRRATVAATVLSLLAGSLLAQQEGSPREKASVADRQLGLSKTSVFEVPSPPAVVDNRSDPGERPVLPRVYAGAPPLIPHGIVDLLPITREQNMCLACHQVEEKQEGMPTPIPGSHYVDMRNAPTKAGDGVAGARYNCVTCHVAQTGAPPLVGSAFGR